MQWIIQASNEAGWLANLFGILTFLGTCLVVFNRLVYPRLQPSRIDQIIPATFAETWVPLRAKAWARVAIVDDQPNDFPVTELKADGYLIQIYRQATLANTAQLARYDIVFLDMKGIVKDDPELGGLKLIGELRRINPLQKICAVSSKTFDPTATEFFRLANDYRKKPMTAQECRAVIDQFLIDLFPAQMLTAAASDSVDLLPRSTRVAVLKEVKCFTDGETDNAKMLSRLQRTGLSTTQCEAVMNLARALASEPR